MIPEAKRVALLVSVIWLLAMCIPLTIIFWPRSVLNDGLSNREQFWREQAATWEQLATDWQQQARSALIERTNIANEYFDLGACCGVVAYQAYSIGGADYPTSWPAAARRQMPPKSRPSYPFLK